ncbi:hypothetical protein [Bacillus sp. 2205SS5-2]|uniref:hypothetical protein n=1 Tax=Bacillus sp. 2205SS5-2 TaxID=3109031 RepID=UPI00300790F1
MLNAYINDIDTMISGLEQKKKKKLKINLIYRMVKKLENDDNNEIEGMFIELKELLSQSIKNTTKRKLYFNQINKIRTTLRQ